MTDDRKTHEELTAFDERARALVVEALGTPLVPLTLEARTPVEGFDPRAFAGRASSVEGDQECALAFDVLSAVVPHDGARESVLALQGPLAPLGYQALVTAREGSNDFCYIYPVGILEAAERFADKALVVSFRAPDPSPLLWVRQTNGINCGVQTADVVRRLEAWRRRCDFAVAGAGFDWVDLEFATLPEDLEAFADEVYEFCPDTLDQGIVVEPPDDLADVSFEEQLEWMDEALETQGTGDLAELLRRTRQLFLWWD